MDIISTLVRGKHEGRIVAVSRRGLRPRLRSTRSGASDRLALVERIEGPIPEYIRETRPWTVRKLVRAVRREVKNASEWQVPFDQLRDALWKVWPEIAPEDKRRFVRLLRPWYDVHRFRAPPPNQEMVRRAEQGGRVVFTAARVMAARRGSKHDVWVTLRCRRTGAVSEHRFDAVIDCTGLDPGAGCSTNPLLSALTRRGMLTLDASGIGFSVDTQCRPMNSHGLPHHRMRVVGPPTAGVFGDPLGVAFIAAQVRRILPGIEGDLR